MQNSKNAQSNINFLKKAILLALAAVMVFATFSFTQSEPVSAKSGGRITLAGNRAMAVCKNWGKSTCITSTMKTLFPGKSTHKHLGWSDTDGFFTPYGCISKVDNKYGEVLQRGGKWLKIRDGFKRTVYLQC